jgi:cytochrome c oxidase assembly protein subunit 15
MSLSFALAPRTVNKYVRFLAWLTLAVQVGIVVTGGAVRLTASGLGCPQWPTCDGTSIVTTPEMGIHGVIEFGNRLLTFVLVFVAIAAFVSVLRLRRLQPELFWLTLSIGLGIPVQAVIGGVSVWLKLNPYVVGLHFIASVALVILSTLFVERTRGDAPRRAIGVARGYLGLGWLMAIAQVVTVFLGILTTGSGPHAGDADAPRNGLNPAVLDHVHSYPAYVALVLTIVIFGISLRYRTPRIWKPTLALLVVNGLQVLVGITQSRTGLPPLLVGTHMLLACLVIAASTHVLYRMHRSQVLVFD